MARERGKDTLKGAATGASMGAVAGPWGAAIGGGLGAAGGYFGWMPGTGGDDGQKAEKARLEQIAKAQQQLAYMQSIGTQQRGNVIRNVGQMYQPVNDRLARLYGSSAPVSMPGQGTTPLERMYDPAPVTSPYSSEITDLYTKAPARGRKGV
jgi:hypothetical protein